ncbi:MAG TPA: beta-propeller fold lactonase family protein [Candidatus Dormibacteraeota bacterium]|nr:beta-propeller fold lactonase family protein [Candidatus Dormibacteraeota bacterium]
MTRAPIRVAVRKWGRTAVGPSRRLLVPACVLAFGVVGWEHLYHTMFLGHSETLAGHATHVLRDAVLAIPLAMAALAGGLWLTCGLSWAAQALGVSLVLGLLLVPATGAHDRIDAVLVTAGHHHEEGTGLLQLSHGLSDALIAMAVAPPLAPFVLWLLRRDSSPVPGRHGPLVRHGRPVAIAAAILLVLAMTPGSRDSIVAASSSTPAVHDVHLTDNPGNWFDTGVTIAGTRSLLVVPPGDTINFIIQKPLTQTVHTVSTLAFPTGAANMPFELSPAFTGSVQVTLTTPGLYVFLCEVHPFMLGAVIVQDPRTAPVLNLGKTLTLNPFAISPTIIPTASDLAVRLVRAFFVITSPSNWQVYSSKNPSTWDPVYPAVSVLAFDQRGRPVPIPDLNAFLRQHFNQPVTLPVATLPTVKGVGEVWIDTEFELTAHKTKPGTATAVNTAGWQVTRKVALPSINWNNPHNMWASRDQSIIYNTQWFDSALTAFDRTTGQLLANTTVGQAPAHVMTRTDTDQVHVTLNGEDAVIELNPGATSINRRITVKPAAQPHAHWMGPDGHTMTTPNSNTDDSSLIDVPTGAVTSTVHTGTLPIATGMMPDASKYYVANFLDSTISVVSMAPPQHVIKTINLLANYDPISGAVTGPVGAFPIQTPVSPDGKFVVTANTLTGTITIIDTATDTVVKSLACDPGCHGVNFGAKKGGGYLAYVSSKFSNSLIVVDPDPNGNGNAADAVVVGRVVLSGTSQTPSDDTVIANAGEGGMGVLPIPIVYNGWVQNVPTNVEPFDQLTCQQRNPLGGC